MRIPGLYAMEKLKVEVELAAVLTAKEVGHFYNDLVLQEISTLI